MRNFLPLTLKAKFATYYFPFSHSDLTSQSHFYSFIAPLRFRDENNALFHTHTHIHKFSLLDDYGVPCGEEIKLIIA